MFVNKKQALVGLFLSYVSEITLKLTLIESKFEVTSQYLRLICDNLYSSGPCYIPVTHAFSTLPQHAQRPSSTVHNKGVFSYLS